MDNQQALVWLRAHFEPGGPTLKQIQEAIASGETPPSRYVAARRRSQLDLNWLNGEGLSEDEPNQRFLVSFQDEDYPILLREIADAPALLFCEGNRDLLAQSKIAVVGARKATAAGCKVAHTFAGALSQAGLLVTSGMALGIDGAAHAGALDSGCATVAVLGTGIDQVYPRQHRSLAKRIQTAGLLISEFPVGLPALPFHFPRRNRIVTGMSLGTLVVEAQIRSGSLVSARLAMEQGREVFAVPGTVLSGRSSGCHQLIRDGACLTECVQDMLQELSSVFSFEQAMNNSPTGDTTDSSQVTSSSSAGLSMLGQSVLQLLGEEVVSLEELHQRLDVDVTTLTTQLLELELAGRVSRVAGGYLAAT